MSCQILNDGNDTVEGPYALATIDKWRTWSSRRPPAIGGTGNALANTITGNEGNNNLAGGGGQRF